MREGILRLGREQLTKNGAAGLSVREIARGLGVASSAVYRHVRDRDELITLLIVDAYTALAECVDGALAELEDAGPADRLRTLAHALRSWAVTDPARWALIYGSPVPGYAAPADDTVPPGTRVMVTLLKILAERHPDTESRTTPAPLSGPLAGALEEGAREFGIAASPPDHLADALDAWVSLIGTVSAEVFGQLGPDLTALGEELLDRWIAGTVATFSLD